MAQGGRDSPHVFSIVDQQRSVQVPLWHNKDKSENPCVAMG